jgi:tRNA(Ile)-lysidine synthase
MIPASIYLPEDLSAFTEALEFFLTKVNADTTVSVAFSGGLDSTVLLHLLSQHELAKPLKKHLYAHYIDHGLQAISLDWKAHCQQICESFQVPFKSSVIEIETRQRQGIESVARKLRYQALSAQLPCTDDVLVTGHHQRDQAETLLLNLVRGAGVAGLSAMPYQKEIVSMRGRFQHIRPLLTVPYEKLVAYAHYFQLHWVEDPSNESLNFKRNVMRHEVLPVLEAHWPNVEKTIARSAQNMSEARLLLDRMANRLLLSHKQSNYFLDLNLFRDLDWLEQKNVIRSWFSKTRSQSLTLKHYEWIRTVLFAKSMSRQNAFSYQLPQGELAFFKDRLYYLPELPKPFTVYLDEFLNTIVRYKVQQGVGGRIPSEYSDITHGYEFMINKELLSKSHLIEVRSLSQVDDLNRKKLKVFFQKHSIPVWERRVWPVLALQGELIGVLGCSNCLNSLSEPIVDSNQKVIEEVKIKVPEALIFQLMGLVVSIPKWNA